MAMTATGSPERGREAQELALIVRAYGIRDATAAIALALTRARQEGERAGMEAAKTILLDEAPGLYPDGEWSGPPEIRQFAEHVAQLFDARAAARPPEDAEGGKQTS